MYPLNINITQINRPMRHLISLTVAAFIAASVFTVAPAHANTADEALAKVPALVQAATTVETSAAAVTVPAKFCKQADKNALLAQVQGFQDQMTTISTKLRGIERTMRRVLSTPLGVHYQEKAQSIAPVRRQIMLAQRAIQRKLAAISAVPVVNCNPPTTGTGGTAISIGTGAVETVDPLKGIKIHAPRFYKVDMTPGEGPVCSEIEKNDILLRIATERANAGHNMNQADQVVWSIQAAQRTVKSREGQNALASMLAAAKAQLQSWIDVLDAMDKIYAAAKKIEVVDCKEDKRTGMIGKDFDQRQYAALLDDAMHTNPFQSNGIIALPCPDDGLDLLYDAQSASINAIHDMRVAERLHRRNHHTGHTSNERDNTGSTTPSEDVTDVPVETGTADASTEVSAGTPSETEVETETTETLITEDVPVVETPAVDVPISETPNEELIEVTTPAEIVPSISTDPVVVLTPPVVETIPSTGPVLDVEQETGSMVQVEPPVLVIPASPSPIDVPNTPSVETVPVIETNPAPLTLEEQLELELQAELEFEQF